MTTGETSLARGAIDPRAVRRGADSATVPPKNLLVRAAGLVFEFFSSMQLVVVTLLLLGIVTFIGTEAQGRGMPLFEVQKHYFESFGFSEHLFGPVWIALPGGLTLMIVLTINLFVGGFVRMRKDWRRAGILLTHSGVALLIVASGIKMWVAEEGAVRLFEGEKSRVFQSYHFWDLVVQEQVGDEVRQWTVPDSELSSATDGNPLQVQQAGWPFELEVFDFAWNATIESESRHREGISSPVVEGYFLRSVEKDPKEHAANRPGLYFEVRPRGSDAAGEPIRNFLWSVGDPFLNRDTGVAFELGDRSFRIDFRKRAWALPFELQLADFRVEFHPNSAQPRLFESVVGVLDEGAREDVPIRMNEPLHRDEFVIYQESYGPSGPDPGPQGYFSQFAVSRNPVDSWPWWSCGVIALGMLWHFGSMLRRYLMKMSPEDRAKLGFRSLRRMFGLASLLVLSLALSQPAAAQEPGSGSASGAALRSDEPQALADAPQALADVPQALPKAYRTWDYSEGFLELARRLPVQHGGRVMPFDTFARTVLMRLNSRTSHTLRDDPDGKELFGPIAGQTLTASEWLLDYLFFPEQAEDYRCIEVTDRDVFVLFGIQGVERRKRDRHSLSEFLPHFEQIFQTVQGIQRLEQKDRSRIQQQGLVLWQDLLTLFSLRTAFEPFRYPVPILAGEGDEAVRAAGRFEDLVQVLAERSLAGSADDQRVAKTLRPILLEAAGRPLNWFWIPPADTGREEWFDLVSLIEVLGTDGRGFTSEVRTVRSVAEAVAATPLGREPFESATSAFVRDVQAAADARGEFDKISHEVAFTDRDWFFNALVVFLIGFHVVLLAWARPKSKWIARIAGGLVTFGAVLVVAGITERCILRERPPISTLYETILFITGTAVVVCLISEWIQRNRVSLTVGALLGAGGMFAARRHELFNGEDTMPQLVAVLDSNFWLAIHVTTINLGYMAMLVAGVLGHAYIFTRILGGVRRLRGGKDIAYSKYRGIGRNMYGALALGVITSTVGTILGGVWAADSWGRFWGWDPKENGALLIVICGLVILHSRIAGLVRDFGIAVLASLSNIVVVYSWFGVNLMGVGLHSYGFQAGLKAVIESVYLVELGVALGGGLLAYVLHRQADGRERLQSQVSAPAETSA